MKGLFPAFCALLTALPFPATGADEFAVVVTAVRDPAVKSYRRIVSGMDLFQKRHQLAPGAELRFKLLPRHRGTRMDDIEVAVAGDSFETPVEVAPDRSFTLVRDALAMKEDALVRPNRRKLTMTWRADIRTPGLPPDTRRLGDLRLECEVGMQAELISNPRPGLLSRLLHVLRDTPGHCRESAPRYLFFAERPIFSVAMVHGTRRQVIPVDSLWAGASADPKWKEDMPYCDCEVLVDRAYFLPLGNTSWPDDTLIEFEYLDNFTIDGRSSKDDIRAAFGEATVVDFDSGYSAWVYRQQRILEKDKPAPPAVELVILFAPSGTIAKAQLR